MGTNRSTPTEVPWAEQMTWLQTKSERLGSTFLPFGHERCREDIICSLIADARVVAAAATKGTAFASVND